MRQCAGERQQGCPFGVQPGLQRRLERPQPRGRLRLPAVGRLSGGNYWTLFTPGIRKVLHAVLQH